MRDFGDKELYPGTLTGWRIFNVVDPPITMNQTFDKIKTTLLLPAIFTFAPINKEQWSFSAATGETFICQGPILTPLNGTLPSYRNVHRDWSDPALCTRTGPNLHPHKTSPVAACECGYWVLWDLLGLFTHSVAFSVTTNPFSVYVGYVEAKGKIIVGDKGFRAEYLKLKAFLDPRSLFDDSIPWLSDPLGILPYKKGSKDFMKDERTHRERFYNVPRLDFPTALIQPTSSVRDFFNDEEKQSIRHNGQGPFDCVCDVCWHAQRALLKYQIAKYEHLTKNPSPGTLLP